MPTDRCWSNADRELAAAALLTAARSPRYRPALTELSGREREHFDRYAGAVLDALTAAGWRPPGRVTFVREGENPCGAPHPEGGQPCQFRRYHEAHGRPASGGWDAWREITDAR